MAQQLHTYLRWTSIKIEQSDYVKANIDNPELSIAGASVGADLVLFYIRESSFLRPDIGANHTALLTEPQNSIVTM